MSLSAFWDKLKLYPHRDTKSDIGAILAYRTNKDTLLGVTQTAIPDPVTIRQDLSKLVNYSHSDDYKRVAEELWARVIASFDVIMDEGASQDKVNYHRAKARAHLEDLRLAYQAREMVKQNNTQAKNVPSPR